MLLLTKTCPKMVLPHKGGSLCVKDVFAKKFFGAGGEIPLAARSHQFFGSTLLKAGYLMRLSVVTHQFFCARLCFFLRAMRVELAAKEPTRLPAHIPNDTAPAVGDERQA